MVLGLFDGLVYVCKNHSFVHRRYVRRSTKLLLLEFITFVRVYQRVDHVDAVRRVVQYPPDGGHRVVELPEHATADHKHQVVENGDGHEHEPLKRK